MPAYLPMVQWCCCCAGSFGSSFSPVKRGARRQSTRQIGGSCVWRQRATSSPSPYNTTSKPAFEFKKPMHMACNGQCVCAHAHGGGFLIKRAMGRGMQNATEAHPLGINLAGNSYSHAVNVASTESSSPRPIARSSRLRTYIPDSYATCARPRQCAGQICWSARIQCC